MKTEPSLILRRFIFLGCCVFALILPFDFPLKHINIYLPFIKSLLVLYTIILLVFWELVITVERRVAIRGGYLAIPIFLFFLLHIFSSVFASERMVWSLKYTFRFFGLGLIFFLVVNFVKNRNQLDDLINCLFLGAALVALSVLIQYHRPYLLEQAQYFFEDASVSPHRIRGIFGWPTTVSVYLGTLLPLVMSYLIYKPKKRNFLGKLFYTLLILIILASLVLSKTRGWILGLFCGLGTILFLHLLKEKDYTTFFIIVTVFVIALAVFFITDLHKFIISDLEPSELMRNKLIKEAVIMIKQHPIEGIGADMFFWKSPLRQNFRTHNIFIENAVNLGAFGFLILLWFFYRIFRVIGKGIFKEKDFKNSYVQVGIIGSLASFLGHSQIDHFWQVPEIIGLFWVMVGIGVCAHYLTDD